MKKIIIVSAILAGLVGCSSSDTSTPASVSGTVTTAQLIGTWLIACDVETLGSSNGAVTLTDTTGDVAVATYDDANCQTPNGGVIMESFTYTLGADFALDGTVAGITTGTELDSIDTGTLIPSFNSIALVGTSLYLGDDEADPAKDASTPAARPTKLDDVPLTKQ